VPPHVAELYAKQAAPGVRQVRNERDRDDDAKGTVLAAGRFLRQVAVLLGDDRLHPDSRDLLGWYEEEITAARSKRDGRRLDALAAEFGDDWEAGQFRRAKWWQGTPAIEGTVIYDEDQGDAPDDAPLAIGPASARAADYAGAMSALGWRMIRTSVDGCQVDADGTVCGSPWAEHIATASWPGGLACSRHLAALGQIITGDYDRRSSV